MQIKKHLQIKHCKCLIFKWAQLGSNQRPPDYESGSLLNNTAIVPNSNIKASKWLNYRLLRFHFEEKGGYNKNIFRVEKPATLTLLA